MIKYFKIYLKSFLNIAPVIVIIFILVFFMLGYSISNTAKTKSMYPYIDYHCILLYKEYDMLYYNVSSDVVMNVSENYIKEIEIENNETLSNYTKNKIYENLLSNAKEISTNDYISKDVKIGDVIGFVDVGGRGKTLHRVIDNCYYTEWKNNNGNWTEYNITQRGFITKGDNNTRNDGCVDFNNIVSKLLWKSC